MDYADIYYVDPRNATVSDHRAPASRVPIRTATMVPTAPAAMVAAPASAISPQYQVYPPTYPSMYPQYPQYPQYVMGNPAFGGNFGNLGAIVNGFGGVGTLVDIVAQVFAAVMPLPAAPTPVGDSESNTTLDTNTNTKNLITYQSALASYAKRDEQIRTIGSLIKKLVG